MKRKLYQTRALAERVHYRLLAYFGLRASTMRGSGDGLHELEIDLPHIRETNRKHRQITHSA